MFVSLYHCFLDVLLKPVLNWENVCSPEHTSDTSTNYDSLLIELLVRRLLFGQSKLYFILNWLVMRCKLRPELAADAQQTAWSKMEAKVKSIYYHHPLQGTSTNYYLILGLRDKAAPPTSQQINKFPPKRVKNLATPSSIFIFIFSSSTGELCSQPVRGNDRPIGRMFPEHVERSF